MVLKLQLEETAAPVAPPSTDAPAPQPEAPHAASRRRRSPSPSLPMHYGRSSSSSAGKGGRRRGDDRGKAESRQPRKRVNAEKLAFLERFRGQAFVANAFVPLHVGAHFRALPAHKQKYIEDTAVAEAATWRKRRRQRAQTAGCSARKRRQWRRSSRS